MPRLKDTEDWIVVSTPMKQSYLIEIFARTRERAERERDRYKIVGKDPEWLPINETWYVCGFFYDPQVMPLEPDTLDTYAPGS